MTTILVGKAKPGRKHTPPYITVGEQVSGLDWQAEKLLADQAHFTDTVEVCYDERSVPQRRVNEIGAWVQRGLADAKIRIDTTCRASRSWVRNILRNAPTWFELPIVQDGSGDGPVILAAAGPSLDRNLDEYMARHQHVPVITVNTSYRSCRAHGLDPIAVAIEAVDVSRHVSSDTRMILDRCTNPAVFTAARPVATFHGPALGKWTWAGRSADIDAGYCAMHAAYSIARRWGHDPIILIGSDLAFSDDGRMYAESTHYADARLVGADDRLGRAHVDPGAVKRDIPGAIAQTGHMMHIRQGWHGNVRTTNEWDLFRRWWARKVDPDRRCINATGDGVLIDYWEHTTLPELDLPPGRLGGFQAAKHGTWPRARAELVRRLRRVCRLRTRLKVERELGRQALLTAWAFRYIHARPENIVSIAHEQARELLAFIRQET